TTAIGTWMASDTHNSHHASRPGVDNATEKVMPPGDSMVALAVWKDALLRSPWPGLVLFLLFLLFMFLHLLLLVLFLVLLATLVPHGSSFSTVIPRTRERSGAGG